MAPLQGQLLQIAQRAIDGEVFDREAYKRLSRRWEVWGLIAIFTPLAALALMVFKPAG